MNQTNSLTLSDQTLILQPGQKNKADKNQRFQPTHFKDLNTIKFYFDPLTELVGGNDSSSKKGPTGIFSVVNRPTSHSLKYFVLAFF